MSEGVGVGVFDPLLPAGPLRLALPVFHWCWLGLGLFCASLFDLLWRRVPNWLTVALFASGLLARGLVAGLMPVLWGLSGALAAFLLLFIPFKRRWLGAGDVKLVIAIGGWLGPLLVGYAVLTSAVLGGLLSVAWLLRSSPDVRRQVRENLKATGMLRSMPEVGTRATADSPPLAPAIAVGTAAVLLLFSRFLIAW